MPEPDQIVVSFRIGHHFVFAHILHPFFFMADLKPQVILVLVQNQELQFSADHVKI